MKKGMANALSKDTSAFLNIIRELDGGIAKIAFPVRNVQGTGKMIHQLEKIENIEKGDMETR